MRDFRVQFPRWHGSNVMRRRNSNGRPSGTVVLPMFYAKSQRLHAALIAAIMSSARTPLTTEEISEMRHADQQNRVTDGGHVSEKDRVLGCVKTGCADAIEIAGVTGLPKKSVSAWLSVLRNAGLIEQVGFFQADKKGPKAHLYRAAVSRAVQP